MRRTHENYSGHHPTSLKLELVWLSSGSNPTCASIRLRYLSARDLEMALLQPTTRMLGASLLADLDPEQVSCHSTIQIRQGIRTEI